MIPFIQFGLGGCLLKTADYQSFYDCIYDLLCDEAVRDMEHIRQHTASVTRLDHSMFVAYTTFRICRLFNLRFDEAARGALLHDLFMYDQHLSQYHKGHLRRHPAVALENASSRFPLSGIECDAICHHMWPFNIKNPPRSMEAVIVCLLDKVCSVAEVSHLYHLFRMPRKLGALL